MSDSETVLQLLDNLTAFGILALVVVAFIKMWVIPTPMQTKIDLLRADFDANRVAQNTLHEVEVQELRDRYTALQDAYRNDMMALQEQRIKDLEQQLVERDARVEQGIRMLTSYTEAQDRFSTLADLVKDST